MVAHHPALAAPSLGRPDREIGIDAKRAVAPGAEGPGREPEGHRGIAEGDVACKKGREPVERLGDGALGLAGAEPGDPHLATHRRGPGIGMTQGERRGQVLSREPVAARRDDRELVGDGDAIEEHAVGDVLGWVEQADRLAAFEEFKGGRRRPVFT